MYIYIYICVCVYICVYSFFSFFFFSAVYVYAQNGYIVPVDPRFALPGAGGGLRPRGLPPERAYAPRGTGGGPSAP